MAHTQKHIDEDIFWSLYVVFPLIAFITIVPMPYGWSEMNMRTDTLYHLQTWEFFSGVAAYVLWNIHAYRVFKERVDVCDGQKTVKVAVARPATEKTQSARIVRKGGQMTIYDESNRVVYKKL